MIEAKTHDEVTMSRHLETVASSEQAIDDFSADPTIAQKTVGTIYLDSFEAQYLHDTLPKWINEYSAPIQEPAGVQIQEAMARLGRTQFESMLAELSEVLEGSPEYVGIEITALDIAFLESVIQEEILFEYNGLGADKSEHGIEWLDAAYTIYTRICDVRKHPVGYYDTLMKQVACRQARFVPAV